MAIARFRERDKPPFSGACTTFTRGSRSANSRRMDREPSVEASSTQTISSSRSVCEQMLSRHWARYGSTL